MRLGLAAVFAALMMVLSGMAMADEGPKAAPTTHVTERTLAPIASPQAGFDAWKATKAYLSQVKGEARAKSDSYFEGGYVLILVDAVYAIIVSAILLWLGISARIRDFAQRQTKSRFWQVPIYVIAYTILTIAMTFPLTVYEDFFREHAYGLSNQNFMQWFGDFGKGFGINIIVVTIFATVLYSVIRRAPRTWWIWGTVVTIAFMLIGSAIYPVFIAPVFNQYQPLHEGALKDRILSIARSEGIPATNVYEFDASRQTKRVSANVSGMFGTTRISMNDNLLNRCTPDEIVAVLGHEMGHYVLDHVWLLTSWFGILFFVGFAFVHWGFGILVRRYGKRWGVTTIDDPAGLPVLMALFTIFFLVATPVRNTITRTAEAQADIFGVNAVRQPDGFAKATLMLAEYRKLEPTPLEEFVFYDHPSGRSRIYMMMRWKAEHLNDWDIKNGPKSPQ
ncbi:MAG TPA: M48 family metallopeptidase [Rhizomicrobium sp.]|nr:M48 family metallopeptidase [Rhizomicrobium sp.]